ncbi:MAG: thiamine phosphate synthase [Bacteroidota bacterium]
MDKIQYISQKSGSGTHLNAIESVLKAGGKWIQLRIKNLAPPEILDLAIQANVLCASFGAKLIVNDHPDIAFKVGAYGVHLGLQDMPIREARAIVGPKSIIGGTANTFEHILQRVSEGADYIGLGPYRFTTTKENLSPVIGLEGYLSIMEQVHAAGIQIPIIAIGGILATDIPELVQAGLYGVAVSGALTNRPDASDLLHKMYTSVGLNKIDNLQLSLSEYDVKNSR